ncbi:MAG: helix-turn-helix domain-containing protein [Christensenellaceae bacterium]|nr:helix-turn-helix domain-containing protein [Christensenellaceae bacterium]
MDAKLCITVEEMAKKVGICKMNAYELARSSGFPSIIVGRRILIPVAGLERWLEEQAGKRAV